MSRNLMICLIVCGAVCVAMHFITSGTSGETFPNEEAQPSLWDAAEAWVQKLERAEYAVVSYSALQFELQPDGTRRFEQGVYAEAAMAQDGFVLHVWPAVESGQVAPHVEGQLYTLSVVDGIAHESTWSDESTLFESKGHYLTFEQPSDSPILIKNPRANFNQWCLVSIFFESWIGPESSRPRGWFGKRFDERAVQADAPGYPGKLALRWRRDSSAKRTSYTVFSERPEPEVWMTTEPNKKGTETLKVRTFNVKFPETEPERLADARLLLAQASR